MDYYDLDTLKETAQLLIDEFNMLRVIYLRVSTTDKGQQEEDQLDDILRTFNLKENECLIIKAKETAFKEKKQESRVLNTIVKPLIKYENFEEENKFIYVWDLDRLYRNQDRQVDFIRDVNMNNCIVLSYRQKFLHQLKEAHQGIGKAMYNFMIEMLAWLSEEESRKKSDRVKKSMHVKDGRFYSNKNNLCGRKMVKSINRNGKKIYYTVKELDLIESIIIKLRNKKKTIQQIKKIFLDKKDIKLSNGYVHSVIKKKNETN